MGSHVGLSGQTLKPMFDLAGSPADPTASDHNGRRATVLANKAIDARPALIAGQAHYLIDGEQQYRGVVLGHRHLLCEVDAAGLIHAETTKNRDIRNYLDLSGTLADRGVSVRQNIRVCPCGDAGRGSIS